MSKKFEVGKKYGFGKSDAYIAEYVAEGISVLRDVKDNAVVVEYDNPYWNEEDGWHEYIEEPNFTETILYVVYSKIEETCNIVYSGFDESFANKIVYRNKSLIPNLVLKKISLE